MQRLHDISARLRERADGLADTAAALRALDPGARGFGADASGRLGRIGRGLHARLNAAVSARAAEADAAGCLLIETATALRAAAEGYQAAEEAARRRHPGEP